MPEPNKSNRCVVECTRRVFVELAEGVTQEQFVKSLNERHVRLEGDELRDGYSGELLGRRVISVNASDYELAEDQCPLPDFDTLDIYDFSYNQI